MKILSKNSTILIWIAAYFFFGAILPLITGSLERVKFVSPYTIHGLVDNNLLLGQVIQDSNLSNSDFSIQLSQFINAVSPHSKDYYKILLKQVLYKLFIPVFLVVFYFANQSYLNNKTSKANSLISFCFIFSNFALLISILDFIWLKDFIYSDVFLRLSKTFQYDLFEFILSIAPAVLCTIFTVFAGRELKRESQNKQ